MGSAEILAPFVVGENAEFFGREALLEHNLVLGGLSAFKISQKREALLLQRMQRARGDVVLFVCREMVFQLLDARARPQQLHCCRTSVELVSLDAGCRLRELEALQFSAAGRGRGEQLLQHENVLLLGDWLR